MSIKREKFGESLDVFENHLIIKVREKFIGVPMSKIVRVEEENIYIDSFDESEAEKIGEKWVAEKSKPVSLEELEKLKAENE